MIGGNLIQRAINLLFGGAGPLDNRNYFIDPNFDSWIGTTSTLAAGVSGYAISPMYFIAQGTGGAATVSQFDTTTAPWTAATSVMRWALRWQQTTLSVHGSGGFAARRGRAEVRPVESATLSILLATNDGTTKTIMKLVQQQNFGSGGSPSAAVVIDPTVSWSVGPTPKKFSVRVDFLPVSGKTFGTTANTDYSSLGLYLPSGVTFDLLMGQWQIEPCAADADSGITGAGGDPTTFEWRGEQAETARVTRYYEQIGQGYGGYASSGFFNLATQAYVIVPYNTKRIAPVLGISGSFALGNATGSFAVSGISNSASNLTEILLNITTSGGTSNVPCFLAMQTPATYLALDSRF